MAQDNIRNLRVPDELWQEAQEIARRRGETVSEVMRAALRSYVRRHRLPEEK